ncbi:MAG: hypothetical protein ACLPY5_07020 [Candidatus Bathyarchaeia archaeon]
MERGGEGVELSGILDAFKQILASRLFFLVTTFTALGYLTFFVYLDLATGTPTMAASSYFVLFYSLSAVSSGLNAYFLRSMLAKEKMKANATVGSASAITALLGGVIGCSCHSALPLPLLAFIDLSSIPSIGVIIALVEYQVLILVIFILVDLYLAYHVLGNIQLTENVVFVESRPS